MSDEERILRLERGRVFSTRSAPETSHITEEKAIKLKMKSTYHTENPTKFNTTPANHTEERGNIKNDADQPE